MEERRRSQIEKDQYSSKKRGASSKHITRNVTRIHPSSHLHDRRALSTCYLHDMMYTESGMVKQANVPTNHCLRIFFVSS